MDYIVSLLPEKDLKCTALLALEDDLFIFICNVNDLHIYVFCLLVCMYTYIDRHI